MSTKQPQEPVLITTPIFYVNGAPHIGHLYTVVLGDALARWHRILGHETLYTVGTDEHGIKVQEAAKKAGKDVKQFCDEVTLSFSNLWREANIHYDDYIRTTEPRHKRAVEQFWKVLAEKDKIYLGEFEGWYSVSDEAFFTPLQVEDELDANGKLTGQKIATETGNVVTWLKEPNYKFRLSEFVEPLLQWIEQNSAVYPPVRAHELIQDLTQKGLKDLSVSRLKEKIQWGITTPGDDSHVIYVWLDALTNYLTVCGYPDWDPSAATPSSISAATASSNASTSTPSPTTPQDLKKYWPADYHIIGKDILKFHTVYWPAFLLSAGLPLPKKVIAHGHWTKDKRKISKSKGNIVDPHELITKFGVDPIRFVLLRQGGLATDGDYNEEEAQNIVSDELANSLGNLISRVTSKGVNPSGDWPSFTEATCSDQEKEIIERIKSLTSSVDQLYKQCEFGKAIGLIFGLVADVNLYLTLQAPWKLLPKAPKKPKTAATSDAPSTEAQILEQPAPTLDPSVKIKYENTLYLCLETVRLSTLLLQPVIPTLSDATLNYLGIAQTARNPFVYTFGVQYSTHSTLKKLSGELFVLVDEREKKQAKLEKKQKKSN